MKRATSISDAESVVMDVLWRNSPVATEDIIAALPEPDKWQPSTVKTLLTRLLKKGVIRSQKDGRRFLYSPILQRDEWLTDESTGLLDRLFEGRIAPLVAHFSQKRKLSKRDLAELKQIISELDDNER